MDQRLTHPMIRRGQLRAVVHSGAGSVARPHDKDLVGSVQVGFSLEPNPVFSWSAWDSASTLGPHADLDDWATSFHPTPVLPPQALNPTAHVSGQPALYRDHRLYGRHTVGKMSGFDEVRFLVINGPESPHNARFVAHPGNRRGSATDRLIVSSGKWRIVLDEDEEPKGHMRQFRVTHYGSLTRTDARTFGMDSAELLLHRLVIGLTFMKGSHAGLLLPVGMRNGAAVGVLIGNPRVDPKVLGGLSWYTPHVKREPVEQLLGTIVGLRPRDQHDEVTRMALLYANQSLKGPVEAGLAHAMAGLEYLADDAYKPIWLKKGVVTAKGKPVAWQSVPAAETVGGVGDVYRLPGTQHDVRAAVARFKPFNPGHPKTFSRRMRLMAPVAWARNQHLHGKAVSRHLEPDAMWVQTWTLASEWLTVALLRRLSYQGTYWSRLGPMPKHAYELNELP